MDRHFDRRRRIYHVRYRRISVPIRLQTNARTCGRPKYRQPTGTMRFTFKLRPFLSVLACAVALGLNVPAASAQSGGNGKAPEPQKPTAESVKESQKKIDEIAEAARILTGPAGNPECGWLGRRVVTLLWRDDMDTAFRHLDLYDRFGCPSAHIQATSVVWSGREISI